MEHAGISGGRCSNGLEMEAYYTQLAAKGLDLYFFILRKELNRKFCDHKHEWYNGQGQIEVTSFYCKHISIYCTG